MYNWATHIHLLSNLQLIPATFSELPDILACYRLFPWLFVYTFCFQFCVYLIAPCYSLSTPSTSLIHLQPSRIYFAYRSHFLDYKRQVNSQIAYGPPILRRPLRFHISLLSALANTGFQTFYPTYLSPSPGQSCHNPSVASPQDCWFTDFTGTTLDVSWSSIETLQVRLVI